MTALLRILLAFCALLSLTIAFVDWPLTSMMKGAGEVMILLVGAAVLRSIDRFIRTLHPERAKRDRPSSNEISNSPELQGKI